MVELTDSLNGFRVHFVEESGRIWLSEGYSVYKSDSGLKEKKKVYDLKDLFSPVRKYSRFSRPLERLIRAGILGLVPLSDHLVVLTKNDILTIDRATGNCINHFGRTEKTPFAIEKGPNGDLYWGEYFMNPAREEVSLYSSMDEGKTWHEIYSFPKGQINHVHRVKFDSYRDGFWVLSGDRDEEAMVLFTRDFDDFKVIMTGSQQARAADLIVTESGAIIPTDSPTEQNYVHNYDSDSGKVTDRIELPGTTLWATEVNGYFLLSTVVEPREPVNIDVEPGFLRKLIYLVSFRRHAKNYEARIWYSKDGKNWQVGYSRKKDIWPMPLFQFGKFSLPTYEGKGDRLYANGIGVKEDDDRLLEFEIGSE